MRILGRVRYVLQVPLPPIFACTPLLSTNIPSRFFAKIPEPAVKESPIAAMTSMSPGLKRWTEFGILEDLPPKENQSKY